MNSIWLYIALMLLAALAFVLLPMLRVRKARPDADTLALRKSENREAYRQRLQELEDELQNGQWTREEFDRLSNELKLTFLRDMEELEALEAGRHPAFRGGRKWLPIVVVVLIPLIALFFYQRYGSAYDLEAPGLLAAIQSAETEAQQESALRDFADFLQGRLERVPDDVRSGYMLGTLYMGLDNYAAAEETFRRLLEHVEEDADRATILGQLAQSQYLNADRSMTEAVNETIDRTLALNPNEQAVMSLLAIEAFMEEDIQGALGYWRRQLNQLNPGSRDARMLQQRINQVQQILAEQRAEQGVGEVASQEEAAETGPEITVNVSLAPELQDQVEPGMRVFVFVRSTQMPMPLAAQTFPASELPLEVTLDESMAMMPQLTLSSAETVIVGARVSRTGQAIAEPGDFQILSEPLELSELSGPVNLEISEIVE